MRYEKPYEKHSHYANQNKQLGIIPNIDWNCKQIAVYYFTMNRQFLSKFAISYHFIFLSLSLTNTQTHINIVYTSF